MGTRLTIRVGWRNGTRLTYGVPFDLTKVPQTALEHHTRIEGRNVDGTSSGGYRIRRRTEKKGGPRLRIG